MFFTASLNPKDISRLPIGYPLGLPSPSSLRSPCEHLPAPLANTISIAVLWVRWVPVAPRLAQKAFDAKSYTFFQEPPLT